MVAINQRMPAVWTPTATQSPAVVGQQARGGGGSAAESTTYLNSLLRLSQTQEDVRVLVSDDAEDESAPAVDYVHEAAPAGLPAGAYPRPSSLSHIATQRRGGGLPGRVARSDDARDHTRLCY